jgi:hypothetical protein
MINPSHLEHVGTGCADTVLDLLRTRGMKETLSMLGIYSQQTILKVCADLPVSRLTAITIRERLAALAEGK